MRLLEKEWEKIEGTLAEFSSLRESVFDFQFGLIDALVAVVRGNAAKELSESIDVAIDSLE